MKSFIPLLLLWATILFCPGVYAQQKAIVPLKPGDTLPPAVRSHILSHISQPAPEIILLPFWSSWCGSSTDLLPRLQALQQQWPGRVALLPVTSDPASRIDSFRRQHTELRHYKGPLPTGDTLLRSCFPYAMVPHVVWLQPSGRVMGITDGEAVTPEQVRVLLSGAPMNLPVKQDVIDFDAEAPLLKAPQPLLYHSVFMPYRLGLQGGLGYQQDSSGGYIRVYAINMALPDLYTLAFAHMGTILPNRWRWQLADTTRLHFNGPASAATAWKAQNLYSYELHLPGRPIEKLAPAVQQDLDRFLGLQSRLEWLEIDCWVLTCKKRPPAVASKGGKRGANFSDDKSTKYLRNLPLRSLVHYLNSKPNAMPVIDETGFDGPVDLALPANLWDLHALKRTLESQGLRLRLQKRKLLFVTISDAP